MPKIKIDDSTLTSEEIKERANQLYWSLSDDNDLAAEFANRVKDLGLVQEEDYRKKIAKALREIHAINSRELLLRRASAGIAKARFKGLEEEVTKEAKQVLVNNLEAIASVFKERKKAKKKPEEEGKPPTPPPFPGIQLEKDQILNFIKER